MRSPSCTFARQRLHNCRNSTPGNRSLSLAKGRRRQATASERGFSLPWNQTKPRARGRLVREGRPSACSTWVRLSLARERACGGARARDRAKDGHGHGARQPQRAWRQGHGLRHRKLGHRAGVTGRSREQCRQAANGLLTTVSSGGQLALVRMPEAHNSSLGIGVVRRG